MNEITKALEALDRIFNYCEEIDLHIPKEEQVGYDMIIDINIIRETLVSQKIGHWVVYSELTGEWEGTKKYACDKCGEKVGVFKSNYCPNCGAKMEKE